MKSKNVRSRVERRKRSFENSGLKDRPGFKAPGSNKKAFPKGANR